VGWIGGVVGGQLVLALGDGQPVSEGLSDGQPVSGPLSDGQPESAYEELPSSAVAPDAEPGSSRPAAAMTAAPTTAVDAATARNVPWRRGSAGGCVCW
jgi:hypothetical protein